MSASQATSDEVLIARIAKGDRLAMQVLYARHHVRVYRFVLRLVRNESTAEDLITGISDIGRRLYVEESRREEFRRLMEAHGEVINVESEV